MNRRFWWRCLKSIISHHFPPSRWEALRDEYFVTMPPVYTDWDFLQRVCQQVGFSPVVIREVNEPQTVLAMVSMGIGITLIADSYAQMNWPVSFSVRSNSASLQIYILFMKHSR